MKASRKQEAMWRHTVLACALLTVILAGRAAADTPAILGFAEGSVRIAVQRAVEGAAARLGRSSCQEVFSNFTDESGDRLSATLVASGRSPADAFSLLRFFDDRAAPQCHAGTTLAFTQTGSRVIRVCGLQFSHRFLQNRTTTEIIVIHEFLHALGLGENPPTSDAITKQLAVRCGG